MFSTIAVLLIFTGFVVLAAFSLAGAAVANFAAAGVMRRGEPEARPGSEGLGAVAAASAGALEARPAAKLVAMAAHDARTPLASIRGSADLLAMRPIAPQERRYVANIAQASDQLTRLLGDLTDLAALQSGQLRLVRTRFTARELIEETMSRMMPIAARHGVILDAQDLPSAAITGDRFRLGQTLWNLVGNAIKLTPEGGRVSLRAAFVGRRIRFSVTDGGPGLPPGQRRLVFEPFYQAAKRAGSARPDAGARGWGLGLFIAREIVRAHGGTIGVESKAGRGATFWFLVPALSLLCLLAGASCSLVSAAAESAEALPCVQAGGWSTAFLGMVSLGGLGLLAFCALRLVRALEKIAAGATVPGGETAVRTAIQAPPQISASASGEPRFRPEQAAALAGMLQGEETECLALAAACLDPDLQAAFAAALSPVARAATSEFLSQPRFVEPEILDQLRQELQRLMSGMVGAGARLRQGAA